MPILQILSGVVLLLFGRKMYWLFVAVAGFLAGVEIASSVLANQPVALVICLGLLAALAGALLAVLAQRVAFALGGLFAGGYLAVLAGPSLSGDVAALTWVLFALGGIVGALAAIWLMDWAIIALSSLAGAAAIVGALQFGASVGTAAFLALAIAGVVIQGRGLHASRRLEQLRSI